LTGKLNERYNKIGPAPLAPFRNFSIIGITGITAGFDVKNF